MKKNILIFSKIILILVLMTIACNMPTIVINPGATSAPSGGSSPTAAGGGLSPTAIQAPTLAFAALTPTTAVYATYPGEPPAMVAATKDETYPSNSGDNFATNLFERPFQLDNRYRPDADIAATLISADDTWYYFSTEVMDIHPETKTLDTPFGYEIDFDKDGRGDFLLWATPPYSQQWINNGVSVYADLNRDVGNQRPILSDAPITFKSDGYETVVVSNGAGNDSEGVWARVNPNSPTKLQIAVKKSLINKPDFLFWAWTDFALGKPAMFDYNDVYTASEAGSPYASNPFYPLKALFGMDNTCRVAFGFTPVGNEPGLCGGSQPPSVPTQAPIKTQIPNNQYPTFTLTPYPQKPTKTLTPIPPPACNDVQVGAQVSDGSKWDPAWSAGVTLCVNGDCKHPDSSGYAIWYLPAGGYTIKASSNYGISPASASVKLGCGEKSLNQFVIGPG